MYGKYAPITRMTPSDSPPHKDDTCNFANAIIWCRHTVLWRYTTLLQQPVCTGCIHIQPAVRGGCAGNSAVRGVKNFRPLSSCHDLRKGKWEAGFLETENAKQVKTVTTAWLITCQNLLVALCKVATVIWHELVFCLLEHAHPGGTKE
jgi:hypothetical protein